MRSPNGRYLTFSLTEEAKAVISTFSPAEKKIYDFLRGTIRVNQAMVMHATKRNQVQEALIDNAIDLMAFIGLEVDVITLLKNKNVRVEIRKKEPKFMEFDLKKPCKECPFAVVHEPGWTPEARSTEEMEASILDESRSQSCHLTREGFTGNSTKKIPADQYCAGAILSLMKRGKSNKVLDRAKARGKFRPEEMDSSVEVI